MRRIRGNEIGLIFQEPMTSLNPLLKVGAQIAQAIRLHRAVSAGEAHAEAVRLLGQVEISEPATRAGQYPHQLSGGMRQRVMIAMALACRPVLLLADEPTTALDVTVQAQILHLLRSLQEQLHMGVLFVTHNLGVVAEIADQVEVMYGGQIVESAPVEKIFDQPLHPYTRALLASLPDADAPHRPHRRLAVMPGQPVDPRRLPPGCRFEPRCSLAVDECRSNRAGGPGGSGSSRSALCEMQRLAFPRGRLCLGPPFLFCFAFSFGAGNAAAVASTKSPRNCGSSRSAIRNQFFAPGNGGASAGTPIMARPGSVGFRKNWLSHTSPTTFSSRYTAASPNIRREEI